MYLLPDLSLILLLKTGSLEFKSFLGHSYHDTSKACAGSMFVSSYRSIAFKMYVFSNYIFT